ncbi:MAG: hypothetical protein ABI411_12810 [Tahibacter sp.]
MPIRGSQIAAAGLTLHWLLPVPYASATTIHVSETLGSSPGSAPIAVRYERTLGQPVATFVTRIVYDNTKFSGIVAVPMNGASCSVNQASGFVRVQGPVGLTDIPSAVYCNLTVTIAAHVAANSIVWLTPTLSGPNFSDGGCFDAASMPVNCVTSAGNVVINNFPILFFDDFEAF